MTDGIAPLLHEGGYFERKKKLRHGFYDHTVKLINIIKKDKLDELKNEEQYKYIILNCIKNISNEAVSANNTHVVKRYIDRFINEFLNNQDNYIFYHGSFDDPIYKAFSQSKRLHSNASCLLTSYIGALGGVGSAATGIYGSVTHFTDRDNPNPSTVWKDVSFLILGLVSLCLLTIVGKVNHHTKMYKSTWEFDQKHIDCIISEIKNRSILFDRIEEMRTYLIKNIGIIIFIRSTIFIPNIRISMLLRFFKNVIRRDIDFDLIKIPEYLDNRYFMLCFKMELDKDDLILIDKVYNDFKKDNAVNQL